MAMPKRMRESELYPKLARWLKTSYGCFATALNVGLSHGRVDVIGIRDVGGDLSGEVETIAIEVKHRNQPFATSTGQARGYSVYADRTYLAELRADGFDRGEIDIAGSLGVGLIHVTPKRCTEVLTSPKHQPIARMQLRVFEKMGYGVCCTCRCVFAVGKAKYDYDFSNMTRGGIAKAAKAEKGLIFWNRSVGPRKRTTKDGNVYERRFLCSDCVENLFPAPDA